MLIGIIKKLTAVRPLGLEDERPLGLEDELSTHRVYCKARAAFWASKSWAPFELLRDLSLPVGSVGLMDGCQSL